MRKRPLVRRINTKVSEADYSALQTIVRTYGFRSIYQLLQTLLMCFLRHVDSVRDEEYETGIGVEIDEMFDEMMEEQDRSSRSRATYQRRKIDY